MIQFQAYVSVVRAIRADRNARPSAPLDRLVGCCRRLSDRRRWTCHNARRGPSRPLTSQHREGFGATKQTHSVADVFPPAVGGGLFAVLTPRLSVVCGFDISHDCCCFLWNGRIVFDHLSVMFLLQNVSSECRIKRRSELKR